jgi:hypothetical protein
VYGIVRHFVAHPLPSLLVADRPYDRLPAGVDGHVLDPDHLLALVASGYPQAPRHERR